MFAQTAEPIVGAGIVNLIILIFVISSMLAMGLSLTFKNIGDSVKDYKPILWGLLINIVLIPIIVWLLSFMILSEGIRVGFILITVGAGAPFGPKLAQGAKGNIAFAVSLMIIFALVAIISVPLTASIMLIGTPITIDPVQIILTLLIIMVLPLLIGLLVNRYWPNAAAKVKPWMAKISTYALFGLIIAAFIVYWGQFVSAMLTLVILASVIGLILILLVAWYVSGWTGLKNQEDKRRSMTISSLARNASVGAAAAATVGALAGEALIGVLIFAILYTIVGIIAGRFFAKRPLPGDSEAS